ncbi:MAG: PAS domain-containing protein [Desulfomonilaceae bacterium]
MDTQTWRLAGLRTYGPVNQSHADFLGKLREDIKGTQIQEICDNNVPAVCEIGSAEAFRTGQSQKTILTLPDGRVWNERGAPIFDDAEMICLNITVYQ